jgi:ElaB/YqjD/DUF883 family membrane-anchored ribosome-binding protein
LEVRRIMTAAPRCGIVRLRTLCNPKEDFSMSDLTAAQTDKLLADLRLVVADAEELLRSTAGEAGEGAAELRAKVQASLSRAREGLAQAQEAALEKARAAGRAADDYVHENPWRSIGLAAACGLVVGLLIGRR